MFLNLREFKCKLLKRIRAKIICVLDFVMKKAIDYIIEIVIIFLCREKDCGHSQ